MPRAEGRASANVLLVENLVVDERLKEVEQSLEVFDPRYPAQFNLNPNCPQVPTRGVLRLSLIGKE